MSASETSFETQRLLGAGAMGSVHLVLDEKACPLALKVLKTESAHLLTQFENEVKILSKLRHPHLVEILGFSKHARLNGGSRPTACYWMEYIDGSSVCDAGHKGISPETIISWLNSALSALDYLHSQGILHGDLKPANILIDRNQKLRLVDFGLASLVESGAKASSAGTIPYQAPETLRGESTFASDLFALGTVFFQVLTGFHPRRNAKNLRDLFAPPAQSLRSLNPHVPRRAARVIERMIESNLARRLGTAREALSALQSDDVEQASQEGHESIQTYLMFGRDQQWSHAISSLKQNSHGPLIVLVRGLSGTGKTRFAQELLFHLALEGRPVSRDEGIRIREIYDFLNSSQDLVLILEANDDFLDREMRAFIDGLSLERNVVTIVLDNLSRPQTEQMLKSLSPSDFGSPQSAPLIQKIFDLTQGNPKAIVQASSNPQNIPDSLEELLRQRFENLEAAERRVLEASTLAYGNIGPALTAGLGSVLELPPEDIRNSLSNLGRLGLARGHPTIVKLVNQALSSSQAADLHRHWLDWCVKTIPEDRLALAHHASFLEGHPERVRWVLEAADIYRKNENDVMAVPLLKRCLEGESLAERRDEILRALSNIFGRLKSFQDQIAVLTSWFREFPKGPEGINPLKFHLTHGIALKNLNRLEEARSELERAVSAANPKLTAHQPLLARALSVLANLPLRPSQSAAAFLEQARRLVPENSEANAEILKHEGLMAQSWSEALGKFEAAKTIYRKMNSASGLFSTTLDQGNACLRSDQPEAPERYFLEAMEIATNRKDEPSSARVYQNFGVLECRKGNYAAAIAYLEKARRGFLFFGNPLERALNLLQCALAQGACGNFSKARSLFAEAARQDDQSSTFESRTQEILYLLNAMEIPNPGPSPFGQRSPKQIPVWDLEKRWIHLLMHLHESPDDLESALQLKRTLEEMREKLPESLQIGFEERADYRRFVIGERFENADGSQHKETPVENIQKLYAINKEILRCNDTSEVLILIMDAAMEISKAQRGFLVLKTNQSEGPIPGFEVRVARNMDREMVIRENPELSLTVLKESLTTGDPIVTDNALQDARFEDAPSIHHHSLKSILCLPMKSVQGTIGALYLDHKFESDKFRGADLNALQSFADQAAMALQKAQMIEELKTANKQLTQTVEKQSSELNVLKREVETQREQLSYEYREVIGQSPPMMEVLSLVDRLVDSAIPVWVYGESGTGKEMIARALHFKGPRAKKPFVSENCSTLPETLLESELFGHKKGSFTHADRDKKGLLHHADGGTIFLDEIADMSATMQAKMLRFLQEGEIRPVGSNEIIKVDVRVVSASNKDLQELIADGKFREDLFYRLNGVTVSLPPLRERMEDLPLLARHFLKKFAAAEKKDDLELSPEALEMMLNYSWPGNVRELENTLRTACLFHQKGKIVAKSFHFKKTFSNGASISREEETGSPPRSPRKGGARTGPGNLPEEKRLLLKALYDTGYHKGLAAEKLGISRRYLYTQMLRYGVPTGRVEMKSMVEQSLGL